MTTATPAADIFARHFRTFPSRAIVSAEPNWLASLRHSGQTRYLATGLPTPKLESWHYTNIKSLNAVGFVPADVLPVVNKVPAGKALEVDGIRCVLINGRLSEALSTLGDVPVGLEVIDLATALQQDQGSLRALLEGMAVGADLPMAALNAAFLGDGVVIRIAAGAVVEKPLHLISISAAGAEPTVFHPRTVIVAGAGSRAVVVESHVGFDGTPTLCNSVTGVWVEVAAQLQHYIVQNGTETTNLIGMIEVELAEDARYESFVLTVGGGLVRNETRVMVKGSGADCQLGGAYAVSGRHHVDNTLKIEHLARNTSSRQNFRGVLDENSRGVFQGKVVVARGAQVTDAAQLHKALLLSRGAEIDCKPELEIYADEVKCSHGATVGELDENAMFFLRSRGLDVATARGLLIEAFLYDVIDGVGDVAIREALSGMVADWLASQRLRHGGGAL